jgi:hypothetical protein
MIPSILRDKTFLSHFSSVYHKFLLMMSNNLDNNVQNDFDDENIHGLEDTDNNVDDKHDIDDTKYELNLLEVVTLIITNDND